MKRVYFVRHGESESNVKNTVQGLSDPLSPEGERQALRIAERATQIDFSVLIASDAVRARNTADAISKATEKKVIESALFREVQRPTSLIGMTHDHTEYQTFLEQEYTNRDNPSWKFEDEENFFDLKERAAGALAYLHALPEDDIMVVTHGHFLRFLLATMVLGSDLTPNTWHAFATRFKVTNTGVTVAVHEAPALGKYPVMWRILTWNDHAHFAE